MRGNKWGKDGEAKLKKKGGGKVQRVLNAVREKTRREMKTRRKRKTFFFLRGNG